MSLKQRPLVMMKLSASMSLSEEEVSNQVWVSPEFVFQHDGRADLKITCECLRHTQVSLVQYIEWLVVHATLNFDSRLSFIIRLRCGVLAIVPN